MASCAGSRISTRIILLHARWPCWPLDGDLVVASHCVVMRKLVMLVIYIVVGATLSGCVSLQDAWNESGGWESNGYSRADRFENDGTSGRDTWPADYTTE